MTFPDIVKNTCVKEALVSICPNNPVVSLLVVHVFPLVSPLWSIVFPPLQLSPCFGNLRSGKLRCFQSHNIFFFWIHLGKQHYNGLQSVSNPDLLVCCMFAGVTMAYVNPSLTGHKTSATVDARQREYLLDMIPSRSSISQTANTWK